MKRWLSYIVMAVLCGFYCSSCSDETFEGQGPDTGAPVVRLTIALPGTSRAIGGYEENAYPDNLDPETEGQRSIDANDIYVLQFVDDKLYHVITDLAISQPDGLQVRTLTGHILFAPGRRRALRASRRKICLPVTTDRHKAKYTRISSILILQLIGIWKITNCPCGELPV